MPLQKQISCRVYDDDGVTFVSTINPAELKQLPKFRNRINAGQGECVLDLNRQFDDFGEGDDIQFMNIVRIYAIVVDTESLEQTETLLYTGFISKYEPYIERSGEEGVRVTLLGLGSILTLSYYKSGSSFTFNISGDPETLARAIIDHANSVYTASYFSYSDATTDPLGTSVSVKITDLKWFDALKKIGEVSGEGVWWKIDELGQFWLKPKPSTPTHTFTIGKDIDSLNVPKDSEQVVNDVVVRWESGTNTGSDATSISEFGTRTVIISDSGLRDSTTADQRIDKEIADKKDEKITAELTVNNNYDLESIRVGETCSIKNFKYDSTVLSDNLLIVGLSYEGDFCRLELEGLRSDLGLELDAFVNG